MPSETNKPNKTQRIWKLLISQGLGLILGQLTVALLAIGSFVLAATKDGASAGIHLDDIRPFFEQPSPVHWWFYALGVVLTLLALNTLLATIDNVVRKWRADARSLTAYSAAVVHIAFLVAMLAHLIGGLQSRDEDPVVLRGQWVSLDDEREARLADLDLEFHPNRQLKRVAATVEVRVDGGEPTESIVGYNSPLSFDWGSELYLLANFDWTSAATLTDGTESCSAVAGQSCTLGDLPLQVLAVHTSGHWGPVAVAEVTVDPSIVPSRGRLFVIEGNPLTFPGGQVVRLQSIDSAPYLLLRHRHAAGNPWALLSAGILVLGLAMMGRRWLR